jgi:GPH family glycoside/pentoside/hexuronide:cation symporter
MAIFAVASVSLFWATFALTKERVTSGTETSASIKQDLKSLISIRPWVVLCFAGILTLTSVALKSAVTIHFFKYYVQDDGSGFFWIFDRTSFFLTMNSLALIAGVCCTKMLVARFDKKSLLIVLSLLSAAFGALLFLIPPDAYFLLLTVSCIGGVFSGPTAPIVWAMYGDVADYGAYHFKRRMTGLVFSASMFAQKFGLTIGAGLSGWLLAWFGYVANTVQSEESLLGIRLLFTLIPAGVSLLNVVALSFYTLTDAKVAEIERELALRAST